ncbi:MAG: chromosome segregation protein ScpA [Tepidisphaera sp.]|nr:chromosome segregation protein ScpA [Tepidisphaera sp.]
MTDHDYRVRLEVFEGPMDLLLFLIRKDEVDIHDIPIASITDQYLKYLEDLRGHGSGLIDIDLAGEFLVVAATLMEIKSRMLGPKPVVAAAGDAPAKEATDPRAELVRQLLEYKKYRDAADALDQRAETWRRRYAAAPAGVPDDALQAAIENSQDVELEDLDLADLAEAFRRIAETVNFDRLGEHQVTYDDTPIEVHAEAIVQTLSQVPERGEMEFASIFTGKKRHEMIGLFLAVLDLVRHRRIAVRQESDARILLRLRDEPEQQLPATAGENAANAAG